MADPTHSEGRLNLCKLIAPRSTVFILGSCDLETILRGMWKNMLWKCQADDGIAIFYGSTSLAV